MHSPGLGVYWTVSFVMVSRFYFVAHWCQVSLIRCLWTGNVSKLNCQSLEETFRSFQQENPYQCAFVIHGKTASRGFGMCVPPLKI